MPGKRNGNGNNDRARQTLAQEAARIIVEQGIRDYRVAKVKAAERLGLNTRGALPGNAEIELAISNHHALFGGESHADFLRLMREIALSAMDLLSDFTPRLVGPVLQGTADENSAVNLHVFCDSPESVAMRLADSGLNYRPYERRLKTSRGKGATPDTFVGFQFDYEGERVEATVFPVDGIRQSPISPIDGKPMRRADKKGVRALLENDKGSEP
ncbi:MAG: hypothetical protein P8X81_03900 [Woeseiaceae bacterium]